MSLAITIAQLTPFHVPRLTPIGIALLSGLDGSALVMRKTATVPESPTENGCVYAEFLFNVPEKVSVTTVGRGVGVVPSGPCGLVRPPQGVGEFGDLNRGPVGLDDHAA